MKNSDLLAPTVSTIAADDQAENCPKASTARLLVSQDI